MQNYELKTDEIFEKLKSFRPRNKSDLKNYVKTFSGIRVPEKRICENHFSPMDYLWHCWCEKFGGSNKDCVVWANRGGGKTMMAALATLLDCIFKDGCQVRILGGSYEQSARMYGYLKELIKGGYEYRLAGKMLKKSCGFDNGANVEVFTQSDKSVRGSHIQKLRCDEVELFDRKVFEGAKFVTKSGAGVKAGMEVLSTMHRPYGLMSEIVSKAFENNTPVFKWCVWEVIEKCSDRSCSRCKLSDYCRGRAKLSDGYLKIDDVIGMMDRSSRVSFEAEMLCKRPNLDNAVFGDFDERVHVGVFDHDGRRRVYRGIDFGYVNPFVCLWIEVDDEGNFYVVDEYFRRRERVSKHAENIKRLTFCGEDKVAGSYCDPAGAGRNDVSGRSAVSELCRCGVKVKYRRSGIMEGIELVRRALRDGSGRIRLRISSRCVRLIESMKCYHYPEKGGSELPLKDGEHDHAIDALRYFFVNYESDEGVGRRVY